MTVHPGYLAESQPTRCPCVICSVVGNDCHAGQFRDGTEEVDSDRNLVHVEQRARKELTIIRDITD